MRVKIQALYNMKHPKGSDKLNDKQLLNDRGLIGEFGMGEIITIEADQSKLRDRKRTPEEQRKRLSYQKKMEGIKLTEFTGNRSNLPSGVVTNNRTLPKENNNDRPNVF